jgi:hypothetical protein
MSENGKNKQSAKQIKSTAFPRVTFEEALAVPLAIKEKNGGNPWASDQVAGALGLSPKSNKFFYAAAASRDFGFTTGSRDTAKIELTPFGKEIVYAPSSETERAKKVEAFLKVDVFKKVLEHYKGSDLPEMKYLANTLKTEFDLPESVHEDFSKLFRENCKYLGLESGLSRNGESSSNRNGEGKVSSPPTVTLAEPNKGSKLVAFVIMPFVERESVHPKGFFQEVLRSLLTPAARDAGFIVKTANRQGSDLIQSTIINDLIEADLVVADLTEHNPNVLFELGLRMAHNKPVALVKATGTGRIFDVDNVLRVYEYSGNLWRSTIETDLPAITEHIKGTWDARSGQKSYVTILRGATSQGAG